ncbi:MAG: cell division protein FtsL [Propionibacteriaceae bacterium]|nr:cell division protein FtsL [Propionibacteriaceae bacterium]
MSTQNNPAVPLKAVTNRPGRLGHIPFLAALAVMLIAGMVGLLLLSIKIQQGSVELRQAQSQAQNLSNEAAALRAEVDRVGSVTNLAQQAAALGMRPNPHGAFINLSDGSVTGDTSPATGHDVPNIVPTSGSTHPPVQIKVYPTPSSPPSPPASADGPVVPPDTPTPAPSGGR